MTYRFATYSDLLGVLALTFDFLHFTKRPYQQQYVLLETSNLLTNSVHYCGVAETDEKEIVGVMIGNLEHDIFNGNCLATERFMFVQPAYRNKKVSYSLFKHFLTWAKAKECTEVLLCASLSKDNEQLAKVLVWLGCQKRGIFLTKQL